MNQTKHASVDDDRLDFLDLLAIAAESWKLIITGTFVAALAAVVILFLMPPIYESFSSLPLSPRIRAVLKSSIVLDPVIKANDLAANFSGNMEVARENLGKRIRVDELVKDSGLYGITIQGDTPVHSKAIADSFLTQILLQSKPTGSEAQKIQEKIAVNQNTIADLQKLSERLLSGSGSAPVGVGGSDKAEDDRVARLLSITIEIAKRNGDIQALQHDLDGLSVEDALQRPNLPMKPVPRHRLSSLLGVTGAAFVALIIFAYFRDAIRKLDEDPERARKVGRIWESLGWRRRNKVEST